MLSLLSIFFAVTAAFMPSLPAFIPRIGLLPLYRMRLIRAVLIIIAWVLAIIACVNTPPSFIALPFVLLFSILTILLQPQRIFVSLDDPVHLPASQANLQGQALVLGHSGDQQALAWPFETLAPRHLINDQIGDTPLLVAY
ncbi:MAG: hypothetical protein U9R25_17400 [Chloroflexota bacterium]|nr:hypothetical protein [Chloroflexota bacterium]